MPSESAVRTGGSQRPFKDADPARPIDTAMRAALGVGFAWLAGLYAQNAIVVAGRIEWGAPSLSLVAEALSIAAVAAFTMLMAWLFVVRHPLYLAELVATIGVVIQFLSPWAVAIVVIQFAFQVARMRNEERVLASSFPEYAHYRDRTARLIPGIY
jgi:protein-S-isoprenylcysteine O-methyltransferase Ste14